MYKFADFLNGFGPLKLCVSKVQSVLNSEWFHGFLSSAEAERLLERQPPGISSLCCSNNSQEPI